MKKNITKLLTITVGAMVTTSIYALFVEKPAAPVAAPQPEQPIMSPMKPMGPMGPGRGMGRGMGGPRGHGFGHLQMLRDRIAAEQNPTVKAAATDLLQKIEIGDQNIEALWIIRRDNMQKLHKTLGLPEMRPGMRGPRYGKDGRGRGPGYGYGRGGPRMMDK